MRNGSFVSEQEMDDCMNEMQDWIIDNPNACPDTADTTAKPNQFVNDTGSNNNA